MEGQALFNRLVMIYPGALKELYMKGNMWDIELLKLDTELYRMHLGPANPLSFHNPEFHKACRSQRVCYACFREDHKIGSPQCLASPERKHHARVSVQLDKGKSLEEAAKFADDSGSHDDCQARLQVLLLGLDALAERKRLRESMVDGLVKEGQPSIKKARLAQ